MAIAVSDGNVVLTFQTEQGPRTQTYRNAPRQAATFRKFRAENPGSVLQDLGFTSHGQHQLLIVLDDGNTYEATEAAQDLFYLMTRARGRELLSYIGVGLPHILANDLH